MAASNFQAQELPHLYLFFQLNVCLWGLSWQKVILDQLGSLSANNGENLSENEVNAEENISERWRKRMGWGGWLQILKNIDWAAGSSYAWNHIPDFTLTRANKFLGFLFSFLLLLFFLFVCLVLGFGMFFCLFDGFQLLLILTILTKNPDNHKTRPFKYSFTNCPQALFCIRPWSLLFFLLLLLGYRRFCIRNWSLLFFFLIWV